MIGTTSKAPNTIISLLDCIMGSDSARIAPTPMVESSDYDEDDEKGKIMMNIRYESNDDVWKIYSRMRGFGILLYNGYGKSNEKKSRQANEK